MGDVNISNADGALIGAQGTYTNSVVNVTVNHLSSDGKLQEGTTTIDRASSHYFTGRDVVLQQLESRLCPPLEASTTPSYKRKIFVLYGLPGVGKSQVCLKFVESCGKRFWATFWVNCGDETTVSKDFQAIARSAGLARNGIDENARLGKQLLHISKNWLLVLDNVRNRIDFQSLLPPGTAGCILVTTSLSRLEFWATESGMSYKMEKMTAEESIELLLKVADEWKTPKTTEAARLIVEELGGLPLALVQAGAAMRRTAGVGPRVPLQAYLRELRSYRDRLFNGPPYGAGADPGSTLETRQSVYSTFNLSRHMIESMECSIEDLRASSDALDVLDICSRLHFEDIHKCIFQGISGRGVVSRTHSVATKLRSFALLRALLGQPDNAGWSDDRINRAVDLLASYSLIDFYNDNDTLRFSLNRLVHSWSDYYLRRYGTPSDWRWAKQTATTCLIKSVRRQWRTSEDYTIRRSLYPHIVLLLNSFGTVFRVTSDLEALMAHEFSAVFSENGHYSEAETLLRKALIWRQANLRPDNPKIPDTANDLAIVLSKLARYGEARMFSEAALKARVAIRGRHDPETLQSRTALAAALSGEGRFREAKDIYSDVMRTNSRLLGPDHPASLEAMTNLSSTLRELGDLEEAVTLSHAVWQTHETKLGPEHPETLRSLSCLALNLEYQGTDLQEAERMCELCWRRHGTILGRHHPDTLTSLAQLARCQLKQGNSASAETKYAEVKDVRSKILGPEHPDTILSDIDLAELRMHDSTIDLQTALHTYRNAVAALSKQWGENHLYMLVLRHNMAVILKTLKNTTEAKKVYCEVLASYKKLGMLKHPEALKCLVNLSTLLTSEGQLDEAETLSRQAVSGYEATLGSDNRETLVSMRALGQTLAKRRKYSDAAVCVGKAVDGLRKVYGGDAPDTLEAVAVLATIEKRLGNRERSQRLYKEAATGFRRLGKDHWCYRYHKDPHEENKGPDKALS